MSRLVEPKEDKKEDNGSCVSEIDYFEFEKKKEEIRRRSNQVEQARRNVEALARILPFTTEASNGFMNGGNVKDAISININVMNKVTEL